MNEYPEWLVREIAAAAARGVDDTLDLYGPMFPDESDKGWSPNYIHEWERGAVEVLDALGFAPWGGATYWRSNIQWEAK